MYDFAVRKVNPQPVTARADDIRPYAMTEGFQKIATSLISRTATFGTQETVKQKDVKMYDFAVRKVNPQPVTARADDIRPYAMTEGFQKIATSPISRTATFGTQEAVRQKDVKMYDFAVRNANL